MNNLFQNKLYVYKKDIKYWDNIIIPKLRSDERPTIFYTTTYLTPNYYSLYEFKELVRLAKKGFNIILVLLDINSLAHKQSKAMMDDSQSEDEFLEERVRDVENIMLSLGIPKDQLVVNRASKIWKRLVPFSNPPIFFQLYSLLMEFNAQDLNNPQRISHLVQMPMDMFMALYYDVLYPEHTKKPVDIILTRKNREIAYLRTREKMFEKGLISIEKPILMTFEYVPYLIYDDLIPEWNMTLDEIKYVVSSLNLSKEDAVIMFEKIFETMMERFKIIRSDKTTEANLDNLKKQLNPLQQKDLNSTIAVNLKKYLELMQEKIGIHETGSNILQITSKDASMEIGTILKSQVHLRILEAIDGTVTLTQISKKLGKQVANVSKYITQLKKAGLVEQTNEGTLRRKVNNITFNLDEGLYK